MDGIIIINKRKNCTSHDVVYEVRKLFGKKVGHTGTLDPNAVGVLPILIGKGTELSQFLINHDKKYIAIVKLGVRTDTADVEGKVAEEKEVNLSYLNEKNIKRILKNMVGKQMQTPPMYSAIKVHGKKLYEYARSGKTVDVPEREIEIYDLELLNFDVKEKTITFEIYCSKGTYVRTICEKLAENLGTLGYMLELKRTMVGEFLIEDAITIDELKENFHDQVFLKDKVIGIEEFFKNSPSVILDERKLKLFLNGVMISQSIDNGIVRVYDGSSSFIRSGSLYEWKVEKKDYFVRDSGACN